MSDPSNSIEPDAARLREARGNVQSFLVKKKRLTTGAFIVAGFFECFFFVMMLCFMDFKDQLYWFLFSGFCMVYMPLIVFSWRNAVKIDHLYYRLIDELKYED